ncbi:Wound-responsive family protein [Melia azedarach]|uniref:Wound-responsive family protein n=1 Tax=Melia azedarach TaxID=155640 RepID=A0ACC1Z1Z1_MELAZ|nr:Wound-responsive family protein [Melia azedarach]
MGSTSRAWMVAASIAAVEESMRSIHQRAKNSLRSVSQAKKLSSASSALVSKQKAKQSEESMRTIIYLSSWGPY